MYTLSSERQVSREVAAVGGGQHAPGGVHTAGQIYGLILAQVCVAIVLHQSGYLL